MGFTPGSSTYYTRHIITGWSKEIAATCEPKHISKRYSYQTSSQSILALNDYLTLAAAAASRLRRKRN